MTTLTATTLVNSSTRLRFRKTLLYLNGAFLAIMGGPFAIFDLLSYFFGIGPLGKMLYQVPYTVGMFEAHGLAFILGLFLLRAARHEPKAVWHLTAAGIHALLGSANLLFWALVVQMDIVTAEIVITSIHGLFVVAQFICFWQARAEA